MYNQHKLINEETAVAPVMGTILMILLVVILAAIVASYTTGGMGSLEQAPISSIRLSGVSGSNLTLQHQGGDSIDLSGISITVSQGDSVLKITKVNETADLFMFESGDILRIDSNTGIVLMNTVDAGAINNGMTFDIIHPSSHDVKVSVVDIVTGQMIGEMTYDV